MRKKKVYKILFWVFSIFFIISVIILGCFYIHTKREQKKLLTLAERKNQVQDDSTVQSENGILPEYYSLYEENNDLAGWLQIEGTQIDYPVMQREKEFYLHKNFEKKYSYGGLPFLDEKCDILKAGSNQIVYGHNMNNGTMFHDLLKYKESDFLESHSVILFDTIYKKQTYEVIAVLYLPELEDDFWIYSFVSTDDEEEFEKFKQMIERYSLNEVKVKISAGDEFLTLSTCTNVGDEERFLVIAKKNGQEK